MEGPHMEDVLRCPCAKKAVAVLAVHMQLPHLGNPNCTLRLTVHFKGLQSCLIAAWRIVPVTRVVPSHVINFADCEGHGLEQRFIFMQCNSTSPVSKDFRSFKFR